MKTQVPKTTFTGTSAALLVSAGLFLLLVAGVQGSESGRTDGQDTATEWQCSNATIQGTYGLQLEGTRAVPPSAGGGTENVIGVITLTFDGMGNYSQIATIKGSVTGLVSDSPASGTYQVNSNCSMVTQRVLPTGATLEERWVITDRGNELRSIVASPASTMVTASTRRIDPPPTPTQVVSRKLHAGTPFDIHLPLAGSPGIECRSGGASGNYQFVFTFPSSVTFNSAAVTAGAGTVSGTGGNGTTDVTVNLTGVSSGQLIAVTLFGVNNGTTTADVSVPMGVLVADVNGDRSVNSGDATITRSGSGQATDATNFRSDVNADGNVNSGDVVVVRNRSGTLLP